MEQSEAIVDQNGIELLVAYTVEKQPSDIIEFHGYHDMGGGSDIILNSVELVIAGRGIELIEKLTVPQKKAIIEKLSFNE